MGSFNHTYWELSLIQETLLQFSLVVVLFSPYSSRPSYPFWPRNRQDLHLESGSLYLTSHHRIIHGKWPSPCHSNFPFTNTLPPFSKLTMMVSQGQQLELLFHTSVPKIFSHQSSSWWNHRVSEWHLSGNGIPMPHSPLLCPSRSTLGPTVGLSMLGWSEGQALGIECLTSNVHSGAVQKVPPAGGSEWVNTQPNKHLGLHSLSRFTSQCHSPKHGYSSGKWPAHKLLLPFLFTAMVFHLMGMPINGAPGLTLQHMTGFSRPSSPLCSKPSIFNI